MHLLGFRFAPRIRDLADTKLYIPKKDDRYDALKPMIGESLNLKRIRTHWNDSALGVYGKSSAEFRPFLEVLRSVERSDKMHGSVSAGGPPGSRTAPAEHSDGSSHYRRRSGASGNVMVNRAGRSSSFRWAWRAGTGR